jgi:hypothetical protein
MQKPFGVVDRDALQQTMKQADRKSEEPSDRQDRITYGVIVGIKKKTGQVQVREFGTKKKLVADGAFLPVATQQSELFMLWGELRKGLVCRIHWRGKLTQRGPIVEVIGDEESNFLEQPERDNEIETPPYKIFSGGKGF